MITSEMLASDEFQTFRSKVEAELKRKNVDFPSLDLTDQRMVYYVFLSGDHKIEDKIECGAIAVIMYRHGNDGRVR